MNKVVESEASSVNLLIQLAASFMRPAALQKHK